MTARDHHPCNPAVLEALEARALDVEVCDQLGIYSCRRPEKDANGKSGLPIPDIRGSIIAYPYLDAGGREVNTKYVGRKGPEKLYFQRPGAPKIFFNLPAMLATELRGDAGSALVIVEGENDVAAVKSAGYHYVVSVPDGGSPDMTEDGKPIPMVPDHELDPANDTKFSYIVNCWAELEPIRRIIIWTDWDGVGQRLRDELARRLGKVRCAFVNRPPEWGDTVSDRKRIKGTKPAQYEPYDRPVKDANEVLKVYGAQAVLDVIASARMIPMTGLYTLDDFQEKNRRLYSTGFEALDPYVQIYSGMFAVVSGIPQSGKSQLWNQIAFNMAQLHSWVILIASFEADIKPDIIRQLRAFYIRKPYGTWSPADRRDADDFVRRHFVFVTRDPSGIEDIVATPEWLCEQIEAAVIRYGVNMALIDPWNQLDHVRRPGEMRDEYTISRIKMVKDTGKRLDVATVIIGHPDKAAGKVASNGEVMSLYDMADGAAWINAAELGVIVHRRDMRGDMTEVFARKVKFRGTGKVGNAGLIFDAHEERFDTLLKPLTPDEDVERAARKR